LALAHMSLGHRPGDRRAATRSTSCRLHGALSSNGISKCTTLPMRRSSWILEHVQSTRGPRRTAQRRSGGTCEALHEQNVSQHFLGPAKIVGAGRMRRSRARDAPRCEEEVLFEADRRRLAHPWASSCVLATTRRGPRAVDRECGGGASVTQ
jgi:hypothetical protein